MSLVSMLFLAVGFLPSLLALKVTFDNGGEAKYALSRPGFGDLNFLKGGQGFVRFVLLPELLALKVTFDNGDEAEYKLLEVKAESAELLNGGQGIVRFAIVESIPDGYKFKAEDEVALKIAFANKKEELKREQGAYNIIQMQKQDIEGVVKAEKALGTARDLGDKEKLCLPEDMPEQAEYLILIMERMGRDAPDMHSKLTDGFGGNKLEAIYIQLCDTLKQLAAIGIVHGDVKPQNMLFRKSSKEEGEEEDEAELIEIVKEGIKLTDFGLAVYDTSKIEKSAGNLISASPIQPMTMCGGDELYMSPIQQIQLRPATLNDCVLSGAYSMIYLGTEYLPWIEYFDENNTEDYLAQRTLVAKYEFNQDPLEFLRKTKLSLELQEEIDKTVVEATKHEADSIKCEINEYKALIDECDKKKKKNEK